MKTETKPNDKASLEASLKDYLTGFIRTDPGRLETLLKAPGWRDAASMKLLNRSFSLLDVLDDDLLKAISSGAIDVRQVAKSFKPQKQQPTTDVLESEVGGVWPSAELLKAFSDIAKRHLNIATLDTRSSDSLDFYDVAVWNVRSALIEAYCLGERSKK